MTNIETTLPGAAESLWDLVVIGAGAAGLMGAIRAAESGLKTLLLEKNKKPGVKILISGGSRCNLTQNTDKRGIVTAYGPVQGPFLHSALAVLPPESLRAMVEAEGVPLKVEITGKVFPASNSSVDVQQAFLRRLHRSGAILSTGEAVTSIDRDGEHPWTITTAQRTVHAKRLLLTTGGKSYPGCGTTGDGYRWASSWGHTIITPRPALVPIECASNWVKELAGLTIPDVNVSIKPKANPRSKPLSSYRGSFLFTHVGCSGPTVLNVSRVVSASDKPTELALVCDWLPNLKAEQLDEQIKNWAKTDGKKGIATNLSTILPHRLVERILHDCKIPLDRKTSELNKVERASLVKVCKDHPIDIHKTLGFEKAEVTSGGIALGEVDSRNMRSKLVPNLWIAGEILDLDGPIGGFNFQAAFATGYLAALDICGEK